MNEFYQKILLILVTVATVLAYFNAKISESYQRENNELKETIKNQQIELESYRDTGF